MLENRLGASEVEGADVANLSKATAAPERDYFHISAEVSWSRSACGLLDNFRGPAFGDRCAAVLRALGGCRHNVGAGLEAREGPRPGLNKLHYKCCKNPVLLSVPSSALPWFRPACTSLTLSCPSSVPQLPFRTSFHGSGRLN